MRVMSRAVVRVSVLDGGIMSCDDCKAPGCFARPYFHPYYKDFGAQVKLHSSYIRMTFVIFRLWVRLGAFRPMNQSFRSRSAADDLTVCAPIAQLLG